jgi:hypothetical protein
VVIPEMKKNANEFDFIGDCKTGASEGNRTLVSSLENCRSTIELRSPKLGFGAASPQRLARTNTKVPTLALSIRRR